MRSFNDIQITPKAQRAARSKFTQEEDKLLKDLVEKYGEKSWEKISRHIPNRTGRQCRDRYCNYLQPGLSSSNWTQEEDQLIIDLYDTIGNHWVEIAKYLKGRSGNNVKNRWHKYLSKHHTTKKHDDFHKNTLKVSPQQQQQSPPAEIIQQKPKQIMFPPMLDIISKIDSNFNPHPIDIPTPLFSSPIKHTLLPSARTLLQATSDPIPKGPVILPSFISLI